MSLSDLWDDPVDQAVKGESLFYVCLGWKQLYQDVKGESFMSSESGDATDLR